MSKLLDDIDTMMIATLRANARTPLVKIARKVGLSRSAAQERLTRLEQRGVIAGYTIRFNPPSPQALQSWLWIRYAGDQRCDDIVRDLLRLPEVRWCDSLAGPIHLLLLVETSSANALFDVRERIAAMPSIQEVTTAPVLQMHFDGWQGAGRATS